MTPWLDDGDLALYHGNAQDVLRELPSESVDCVVTSPPYWGLRDYGTGQWEGGNPDCDHDAYQRSRNAGSQPGTGNAGVVLRDGIPPRTCKCGARRIDQQLGLEPTPDLFVANMVAVFREVRRVLAPHGTCWVNLGDSYAASLTSDRHFTQPTGPDGTPATKHPPQFGGQRTAVNGLKPKDLCGIPWRVAFALQQDGWYLRSDIIWAKPNPMPESVTDRPTKAHEYIFLLTKNPRYWFDAEAVREPPNLETIAHRERYGGKHTNGKGVDSSRMDADRPANGGIGHNPNGRNIRSVWTIPTQPYPEAHFATYPLELARRCILAGCPERVCLECGKPSERIVERESIDRSDLPRDHPEWRPARYDNGKAGDPQAPGPGQRFSEVTTLGWSDCGHNNYRPGQVLDPFIGSGTTALAARNHQRHAIGIDLSLDYLQLAARRLQQLSLLT